MYSYEDRIRAVRLYIKYDFCTSDTVRELGYPNRKMLVRWYKEYLETGDLHNKYKKNHTILLSKKRQPAITTWSMDETYHVR